MVLFCTGMVVGAAPSPITKTGVREELILFRYEDFSSAFSGGTLSKIRLSVLPDSYQGTVELKGRPVSDLQEISADDIKKITFRPARGFIGTVVFMWNGAAAGQGFSGNASTVSITIENKHTVSKLPTLEAPGFIGEGFEHFPNYNPSDSKENPTDSENSPDLFDQFPPVQDFTTK